MLTEVGKLDEGQAFVTSLTNRGGIVLDAHVLQYCMGYGVRPGIAVRLREEVNGMIGAEHKTLDPRVLVWVRDEEAL